jgi:hypothetical protein
MSALGHKQTFRAAIATSALSPKADLRRQGVWSILVASGRSAQEAELKPRSTGQDSPASGVRRDHQALAGFGGNL